MPDSFNDKYRRIQPGTPHRTQTSERQYGERRQTQRPSQYSSGRSGASQPPKKSKKGSSGPLPFWLILVVDVILTGAALCVFSYFHHVRKSVADPSQITALPTVQATAAPAETTAPQSSSTVTPTVTTSVEQGMWGAKFADKFLAEGTQPVSTDMSYKSHDVSIEVTRTQADGVTYFVADIYIRDMENFKTGLAGGTFGDNVSDTVENMAKENNAILAITGDYYSTHKEGAVVRNGLLYRNVEGQDVLVMYNDGSMKTFEAKDFSLDAETPKGVSQVWSFGPMLLDANGGAMTTFNSKLNPKNPRSSVGCYEPGHYCFVTIDGRQEGYSDGMTLQEMSALYSSLGCKAAYNLDGGQSSMMFFGGSIISKPYDGGRSVSDILYIAEKQGATE